ncbi:hypothetical protein OG730_41360 (plasmid) [Streptomyces sp. NBC_01298]|uniref:hypothetical protein n=1 Tax=Streptomyces sp. NBC_01298 TaxID=2903817 RepID=UPI002E0EE5AC|nr:hypothetical protein OG730_42665 [Streptomyces sp. NBC_01298]WSK25918.1 hypothetical protein OG730_41360 [Streptomyces sp. NBC_01298]
MTRLFDRQLAQPQPPSLYDFLQTVQATGDDSPRAMRVRRLLASPEAARLARQVRPGGTGLSVRELHGARVVAAEAVHDKVSRTPAPELFARLRHQSVLPRHQLTFIEAQKLNSLGPVTAIGWLVTSRPAEDGYAMEAYFSTEWGRGKLFSPLAAFHFALDHNGRYRPEAGSDLPHVAMATPEDPQRPGLLPEILDPIAQSLSGTTATLLATLAVLDKAVHLPETIPDPAQSAAYRRRAGRALVSYRRISADTPALLDLVAPHPAA